MRSIDPSEPRQGPVYINGLYSCADVGTILDCSQAVVSLWVRKGILPTTTARKTFLPAAQRGGTKHCIPCLQLYYFISKSGWPITESLRINAANYLFLYGYEPDKTGSLSYRRKFQPDDPVDSAERVSVLNKLNKDHRGYTTFEEWHANNPNVRHIPPITIDLLPPAYSDETLSLEEELKRNAAEESSLLPVGELPLIEDINTLSGFYMTQEDIATAFKCSAANVSRLVSRHGLPYTKLPGYGKRYFFSPMQFGYFAVKRGYLLGQEVLRKIEAFTTGHGLEPDQTPGDPMTLAELMGNFKFPAPAADSPHIQTFTGETPVTVTKDDLIPDTLQALTAKELEDLQCRFMSQETNSSLSLVSPSTKTPSCVSR